MKDLKIGDRILMTDNIVEEEIYMSVGTVKEIRNSQFIKDYIYYAIDFDKEVDMGWVSEELGIGNSHGRYICNIDNWFIWS